eukprot:TRINITY_DN14137_c0_g1_i1.p1 TRINITY_DN14137_c0_g1~~TRINITY_DN14137_c0_g1_i1.p1  ORF type:complete len:206 (-),score=27.84 TRINITY_DN14137_c0_g1_i1:360-977(-)
MISYDDGLYNVSFFTVTTFVTMLREHRHDATQCYFAPPEHCWQELVPFTHTIDPDVLYRTVLWESKRRFHIAYDKLRALGLTGEDISEQKMAKKTQLWTTASPADSAALLYSAKKDIIHSIRYLLFAQQMVSKQTIYDFGAANEIYYELMRAPAEEIDWASYEQTVYLNNRLALLETFQLSLCRDPSVFHNLLETERFPIFLLLL